MEDGRDSKVYTDENGDQWLMNDGKLVRDERGNLVPTLHSRKVSEPGEFTTYDSSNGHCALCGSLTCSGNCFK